MYSAQKVLLVDGENASRPDGANRGRANLLLEQGHFPKEFVRAHCPQLELLFTDLGHCFDLTILDDEHAIARFTLANNNFAFFVVFSEAGHFEDPV